MKTNNIIMLILLFLIIILSSVAYETTTYDSANLTLETPYTIYTYDSVNLTLAADSIPSADCWTILDSKNILIPSGCTYYTTEGIFG